MSRGEYTRLDPGAAVHHRFVGDSCGTGKDALSWKRLKGLVRRPNPSPLRSYILVSSCESVGLGSDHTLSQPADGCSTDSARVPGPADVTSHQDGQIHITFTHNNPCREDGEDEDLCCHWFSSSEDEEDDESCLRDSSSTIRTRVIWVLFCVTFRIIIWVFQKATVTGAERAEGLKGL